MSRVPLEQPPVVAAPLKEWLTRMMILINGAFNTIDRRVVIEAIAESTIVQAPPSLDAPLQVVYDGLPVQGAHGGLYIDTDGTITITAASSYDIEAFLSIGRLGIAQESYFIVWPEVNGIPAGNSFTFTLSNSNEVKPMHIAVELSLQVGDQIKLFIARDSAGQNDGGLVPFVTASPLIPDTKSIRMIIKRQLEP
jgi:hypothetical protein